MLPVAVLRKMSLPIVVVLFLMQVGHGLAVAAAQSIKQVPGLAWETTLGESDFVYEYQAAAISPKDHALWIALRSHRTGEGKVFNHQLWKIGERGERIHGIQLAKLFEDKASNGTSTEVNSLTILENGDFVFVANPYYRPRLIKMDFRGKVLFAKPLTDSEGQLAVFNIVPLADRNLLLLGRKSEGDAVAIKIDANGKSVWEKVLDRGKYEFFSDGIPTEKGGAVVVGISATPQGFSIGRAEILVMKLDKNGEITDEKTFPGRLSIMSSGPGSVTKIQGGGFALVYDKSESQIQDIRIKALNSKLEELWETRVLNSNSERDIGQFKLAAVPSGGFVVAGTKDSALWIALLNADGQRVGEFWDTERRPSRYELVAKQGTFFIIYTVPQLNDKRRLNTKIGAMMFKIP